MLQNYIGINGLVTQSLEDIITDLTTKFKDIYGYEVNVEQNTPDGQWINILAQEKKDMLDLFTQFYNNLDPDRVIGIPQQILYKLNGLIIKTYTYSYTYINVTVSESVTLQGLDDNIENADGIGYTVRDMNGNRWILASTTNLEDPGTYSLNFRSADLGSIEALPNTINVMETILRGVSGVNNPAANYITGATGETSAQFRLRRNQAMAVPSQGFDESTESQMLNLTNVTQCKVYDNRTNEVVNGIPAHGIWVIVEGGTPSDIGRVIYNNLPPGIPMKGSQSVLVPKINGDIVTVLYDVPSPVTLYVRMTIKNFTASAIDTTYIKNQLSETEYLIGERANTADITTATKEIIGNSGNPYNIEISLDNENWFEDLTPVGLDEFFTITPESITITEV